MAVESLKGLRIALYARFSSSNQREESIEDQFRRLERHVFDRGADPALVTHYSDAAMSGAGSDRPAYQAMLAAARSVPRKLDVIVAEDVSRLSRDQADSQHLFRELRFLNVNLICVSDGISSNDRTAGMALTLKSLLAEQYLADLSDKTLRGLEGQALNDRATGGRTLGYRTRVTANGSGKPVFETEVDEAGAALVRRIFQLRLDGQSLVEIAHQLTSDRIPSPRVGTGYRCSGWGHTTIRAILKNSKYIGQFEYKRHRWLKAPGTNRRVKRERSADEIITRQRPDLAIIDPETWAAVQAMFAGPQSTAKRRTRESYLLSGIAHCGTCGAPMTIAGGSSARYYRCSQQSKRRSCSNRLSVREDVLRSCVLEQLRTRLLSPEGLTRARQLVEEELEEMKRTQAAEIRSTDDQVGKVRQQIANLVDFIASGERSPAIREKLATLERQAKALDEHRSALKSDPSAALTLPTTEELLADVFDVEAAFRTNPTNGRALLSRYFKDGRIALEPQPEGYYLARTQLLPLVALTVGARAAKKETALADESGEPCSNRSCAGALCGLLHRVFEPFIQSLRGDVES